MRRFLALFFSMTLALAAIPDLAELNRMIARFAPAPVTADTSKLAPGDKQASGEVDRSGAVIDEIFRDSSGAATRR